MIDDLLKLNPFSLETKIKNKIFLKQTKYLTIHHFKKCHIYKKIIKNLKFKVNNTCKIEDFPMLPVRLFKKFELKSISDNQIIKKLVSSGTTGQNLSKIYLDKKNSINQSKVLNKIMSNLLGKQRLPMLIIDQDPKIRETSVFNARIAAIQGFSIFGKDYHYLLDKKNKINYNLLNKFLKKYENEKFFIFGFTSFIYEFLIKKLDKKKINFNFKNAILLHGGGWKKLEKVKIDNKNFKKKIFNKIKLKNVHNYYGMIEQTGSIFIECKCGHFIASSFSDILIRNKNFDVVKDGTKGLIQLISLLPSSYPGHNILTEDIGEIINKSNCRYGLKGKHFLVHGRAKEAEIRGCSDVR
tara:strand:+ start:287 stop:1348 length:1062 start_codon:yes stop_codon:yes gene_type:complete